MRYPHPWLARLAKVGMVFGVAVGLASVGTALLPPPAGLVGISERWLAAWRRVTTLSQTWAVGREQFEDLAAILVGPLGWLLAAGLLRAVAKGRVGWVGPVSGVVRLARWPAAGCMVVAVVTAAADVHRWVDPDAGRSVNEYHLLDRVRFAVSDGRVYDVDIERKPGQSGGPVSYLEGGPTSDPTENARRIARCLCCELDTLFRAMRSAGVLFFLAGVVYCLGSVDGEAET